MDGLSDLDSLIKTATGGPDTSYVKPTIAKLQSIEGQRKAETDPVIKKTQEALERDKAKVEEKTPESIDVQPWKQTPKETNPVQAFGSLGSVFGILASAFTHKPWTNAMNASAAAINAVKTGDRQQYEDAYEAWKTNTKLMLDRHKEQYQDYQAAMDKMKTDAAEGQAMLTTLAAKYGDQITATMNEAGLHEKLGEAWAARQRAATGLLGVIPQIEEHNMKVHAIFDLQDALKSGDKEKIQAAITNVQAIEGRLPMTASGGVSGSSLTPEGADLEAFNRLLNGKYPPWMRNEADRKKLDNDAAGLASKLGLTMEEAATLPAEKKADAAALLADTKWYDGIKRGQAVLEGSIPIAREYMQKLPLSEIQSINAGIVAGEKEFGSVDANNYANAMIDLALEWGRLKAGPQSAAMLPVEVIKLGMGRMSNVTPDQFEGIGKLIMQDSNNAIKAQEKTINERRKALRSVTPTEPDKKPSHKIGDVIEHGGKKYRITGGDMDDPDVEEIQE